MTERDAAWHSHERMNGAGGAGGGPSTSTLNDPRLRRCSRWSEEHKTTCGQKSWFHLLGIGDVLLKVLVVDIIPKHTGAFCSARQFWPCFLPWRWSTKSHMLRCSLSGTLRCSSSTGGAEEDKEKGKKDTGRAAVFLTKGQESVSRFLVVKVPFWLARLGSASYWWKWRSCFFQFLARCGERMGCFCPLHFSCSSDASPLAGCCAILASFLHRTTQGLVRTFSPDLYVSRTRRRAR